MATGAEIIGTAFYHAFGYHVVEVYVAELDPARLVLSDKATLFDPREGRRRRFSRRDLDAVLRRGARLANGKYRVLVSRFAEGKPLGNFRYYGTRPDDPNDIVPHEHRRELRGARVFGAWLNHDDSRGINSLDMLDHARAAPLPQALHVRLRLDPRQRHRRRAAASRRQRVHLRVEAGLAHARHAGALHAPVDAHRLSQGHAPGRRPDRGDGVRSAALEARVSRIPRSTTCGPTTRSGPRGSSRPSTPPAIRAIVEKARYSDPRATDYMTDVLVKRREKVLRAWLTAVNPLSTSPSATRAP